MFQGTKGKLKIKHRIKIGELTLSSKEFKEFFDEIQKNHFLQNPAESRHRKCALSKHRNGKHTQTAKNKKIIHKTKSKVFYKNYGYEIISLS